MSTVPKVRSQSVYAARSDASIKLRGSSHRETSRYSRRHGDNTLHRSSKFARFGNVKGHATVVAPMKSLRGGIQIVCSTNGVAMKVMIAGAPASGKGTQSQRIIEKYGLEHVCVGDLLREEIAAGTEAGAQAKEYMNRGELVPNEIVVDMVKRNLATEKAMTNGWLLDGYPRSLDQAMAIEQEDIRPDVFLLLNVPDEVIVERVVGRRLDPETGEIYHIKFNPPPADIADRLVQRFDDTEEKVVNRLRTYHSNLDPILNVYKDAVVAIDGDGSIEGVFARIEAVLTKTSAIVASDA